MSTKHFRPFMSLFLALVLSFASLGSALAAPGDLDTTFDGDGKVTSFIVPSNPSRNDVLMGIAIQSNGKIVAAGYSGSDFAVTRYNTNGSLDTTFSGDGRLITNFGGVDQAADLAVQSNGKIVVAGRTCAGASCNLALARYNPGGALDTTFSGDGKLTTDFGGGDNGSFGGLAIQSNGKIVVAGYMFNGADYDFAVYRYLSTGSLDTTFSGDGKVRIDFFGTSLGPGRGGGLGGDSTGDLVIQSDGKIVVAGNTCAASSQTNCNFAVARLTASGVLDTTFSADGKNITNPGGNDLLGALALQPDGKIVIVGEKRNDPSALSIRSVIERFNTNGSLDATFNGTGNKEFSVIPGASSGAVDVIVQSNGKIVVLCFTHSGSSRDFALVRLNPGGAFDSTFSGDGKSTVDFGSDDLATALAVQPSDGKYVLGGVTPFDAAQADFALARVLP